MMNGDWGLVIALLHEIHRVMLRVEERLGDVQQAEFQQRANELEARYQARLTECEDKLRALGQGGFEIRDSDVTIGRDLVGGDVGK